MRYFAYGSNMDARTMQRSVPEASLVGPGRLEGFRLEFNVYSDRWEGGAANLEPDEDGHLWGVVWDIPEDALERLDTFIGHPTFYRREGVSVVVPSGEPTECVTYRVAHQRGYVRPTAQYLARLRGAVRTQGLPPEALDIIESAASPPQPHIST
ncbi:MAG TPA: gamma-glutamylcyclotransferase family protein [Actinomycetota bacterium]|jgi:gamma-glutamylcyclotransferase|nr:gamma-glutamylcyclotransferase family protein [Actinomycetota bacterium]